MGGLKDSNNSGYSDADNLGTSRCRRTPRWMSVRDREGLLPQGVQDLSREALLQETLYWIGADRISNGSPVLDTSADGLPDALADVRPDPRTDAVADADAGPVGDWSRAGLPRHWPAEGNREPHGKRDRGNGRPADRARGDHELQDNGDTGALQLVFHG